MRLTIYSYLDRSTVLHKISILSTTERSALVDSEIASKNKSYKIEIVGQRNAQRKLYGEATRLRYVLRIIENLKIKTSALPTNFGKKLAQFIIDLPERFDKGRVSIIIKESALNKFDFQNFYHVILEKRPKLVFKHFKMHCDYRTVNNRDCLEVI